MRLLFFLFLFSCCLHPTFTFRIKRQNKPASDGLGDFLNGILRRALVFVQPVVEKLQNRPAVRLADPLNDNLNLERLGLCKNQPKLCEFLLCSAQNFKQSDHFANLNFITQVLGDRSLRQSIVSDSAVLKTVCAQAKMKDEECGLFTNGFKLVDQFMGLLEGDEPRGRPKREDSLEYYDYYSSTEEFDDYLGAQPSYAPKDCASILQPGRDFLVAK